MGTRHITQVILDGKTIVSQYGQWDGYPDATGTDILKFLNEMNREQFEECLRRVITMPDDENKAQWDVAFQIVTMAKLNKENEELPDESRLSNLDVLAKYNEAKKYFDDTGMVGHDVSEFFRKAHPTMTRDMGCDILQFIHDSVGAVDVQLDLEFINDSLMCEWAYVINLDSNVLEVYEDGNNLRQSFPLDNLPSEKDFLQACKSKEQLEDEAAELEEEGTSEEQLREALKELRDALIVCKHDVILTQVANYLDANLDDLLEAIN